MLDAYNKIYGMWIKHLIRINKIDLNSNNSSHDLMDPKCNQRPKIFNENMLHDAFNK